MELFITKFKNRFSLALTEWASVLLIFGAMATLCGIGWYQGHQGNRCIQSEKGQKTAESHLAIELTGAVKKPGIYYVVPGTSLKQLLKQAGLRKEADRKKIHYKKILYSEETLRIPSAQPHE